jgi:Lycopene cyclase
MKFVVENVPDYLVGSIFFILAWIAVYWSAPKSRPVILWASVMLLPVGPFLESIYVIDYWHPEHWWYLQWGWFRASLEDLIFAFTAVGICAGFFDIVHRRQHAHEVSEVTAMSRGRLILSGGICLAIIWGLWRLGHYTQTRWLHSVNAHALGCLFALPFVCTRKSWTISAFTAAAGGAVLMCIFYALYYLPLYPTIFERWWDLDVLTGIRFLKIPIEEIYWMATTVLFIGPTVRFCTAVTPEKKWLFAEQCRDWNRQRKRKR